eukprot:gene8003-5760_t
MPLPATVEESVDTRFKKLEVELDRSRPSNEAKSTLGTDRVQAIIDKVLSLSTTSSSSKTALPASEETEKSSEPSFLVSHQSALFKEIEKISSMDLGAVVYGSAFSGKSVTVACTLMRWIEKAKEVKASPLPLGIVLGSRKVLMRWLLIFRKHFPDTSFSAVWTSDMTEDSIPADKHSILLVPLEDHKEFQAWLGTYDGRYQCEGIVIDLRAAWIWDRRSGSIPKKTTENIALAFAVQQRNLLMELSMSLPKSKRMVVADDNLRNMDRLSTLAILLPDVSYHVLEKRFFGESNRSDSTHDSGHGKSASSSASSAEQMNRNTINQMLINLSAHASVPAEVNARAYAQVREEILPVDMTPLQQRKYDDICGQIMMNNSTLFTGESVHQLARLSTALKFICFHGKLADRKDLMNPKARAQVEALEGRRHDLVIRSGYLSQTLSNPQEDAALVQDSNKLRALKAQLQRFEGLRVVVVASEWVELHLIHRYLAAEGIPHLCPNLLLQEQIIQQIQVNPYKINDDNADLMLNWFAEEINTHVFNDKSVLSCVMLATAASFKSPSTTPWLADAIIMLSYDWNQYLDVKNCFRLRLIDAGPSGDPVTVVRLCSKSTIEEVMVKNKASIPSLQDRPVGDLNIIPKYPSQHIHQQQIREEFRHLAKTSFLCNAPLLHLSSVGAAHTTATGAAGVGGGSSSPKGRRLFGHSGDGTAMDVDTTASSVSFAGGSVTATTGASATLPSTATSTTTTVAPMMHASMAGRGIPIATSGSTVVYPVVPGSGSSTTTAAAVGGSAMMNSYGSSVGMPGVNTTTTAGGMMVLGPNGKPHMVNTSTPTPSTTMGNGTIAMQVPLSSASTTTGATATMYGASSTGATMPMTSAYHPSSSSAASASTMYATSSSAVMASGGATAMTSMHYATAPESTQKWLDIFHNVYHESLMEITFRHTAKYGMEGERGTKAREEPTSQSVMRYMAQLSKIATNIVIEQTFHLLNKPSFLSAPSTSSATASSTVLTTVAGGHGESTGGFPSASDGIHAGNEVSQLTVEFCMFRVAAQRLKDARVKERQIQDKAAISRLQRMRIHAAGMGMSDKERRVNSLFIANITDAMTEHYAVKPIGDGDGGNGSFLGGGVCGSVGSSGAGVGAGAFAVAGAGGITGTVSSSVATNASGSANAAQLAAGAGGAPTRPGVLQQFRDALHESSRVGVQAEPWLYTNPLYAATRYDTIACPSYLKETLDFLHGGVEATSMQIAYYDKTTRVVPAYAPYTPMPPSGQQPSPTMPSFAYTNPDEFVIPIVVTSSAKDANGGANAKSRSRGTKKAQAGAGAAGDGTQGDGTTAAAGKAPAKSNKRQKTNTGAAVSTTMNAEAMMNHGGVAGGHGGHGSGGAGGHGTDDDHEHGEGHHEGVEHGHGVGRSSSSGTLSGGIKVTSVPVPGSSGAVAGGGGGTMSGASGMMMSSAYGTGPGGSAAYGRGPVGSGATGGQYVSSYPQQSSVMPQSFFTASRSSQSNTPSHPSVKSMTGASATTGAMGGTGVGAGVGGSSTTNVTSVNNPTGTSTTTGVLGSAPYGTYQPTSAYASLQHPNGLGGSGTGVTTAPLSSSSSISSLYKTTQQNNSSSVTGQNVHLYQPHHGTSGGTTGTTGSGTSTYGYYQSTMGTTAAGSAATGGASTTASTYGAGGSGGGSGGAVTGSATLTGVNTYQPSSYMTSASSTSSGPTTLLGHAVASATNGLPSGVAPPPSSSASSSSLNTYTTGAGYHPTSTGGTGLSVSGLASSTSAASTTATAGGMPTSSSATLGSSGTPWTSLDDDTLIILKQTTYDYQQITACINKLRAQQKSTPRQMQEIIQRYDFLNTSGRVSERLKDQTVINMVAKIQRGATSSIMGTTPTVPTTSTTTGTTTVPVGATLTAGGTYVTTITPVSTGSASTSATTTTTTGATLTGTSVLPAYGTGGATSGTGSTGLYTQHPIYTTGTAANTSGASLTAASAVPGTSTVLPSGFVKTVVSTSGGGGSSNGSVGSTGSGGPGSNLYKAPSPSLLQHGASTAVPSGTIVHPVYTTGSSSSSTSATLGGSNPMATTATATLHGQYYQQQQQQQGQATLTGASTTNLYTPATTTATATLGGHNYMQTAASTTPSILVTPILPPSSSSATAATSSSSLTSSVPTSGSVTSTHSSSATGVAGAGATTATATAATASAPPASK